MVALYIVAASLFNKAHHFTLFPILGYIANPVGFVLYTLLRRREVMRKEKGKQILVNQGWEFFGTRLEKGDNRNCFLCFTLTVVLDDDHPARVGGKQFLLYMFGCLVILVLYSVCNLAGHRKLFVTFKKFGYFQRLTRSSS
jgi:hypothetical protein